MGVHEENYLLMADNMKSWRFILYSWKVLLKNSAELRMSFWLNVFGMCLNNSAFVLLWMAFAHRIGELNGWEGIDILAMLGFGAFAYGITNTFAAGIRDLPVLVFQGELDKYLTSTRSPLLRVLLSRMRTSAIGDILFGALLLVVYGILKSFTALQVLMCLLALCFVTLCFFAVSLCIQSLGFYFISSHNLVTNGIFELYLTPTLYHGGAMQGALRAFFMFVVPSLFVGAVPVEMLKQPMLESFMLLIGVTCTWGLIGHVLFYRGLRRYESGNGMGLGQ